MTEKNDKSDTLKVRTQAEIEQIADQCRSEGRFAFDTEFVMEDRYQPEACLLQVATRKSVYLIDPFLDLDVGPIWRLVPDPQVEVVVHAGQEDLALSVQHTGQAPQNIFDVQVVAGFVGYDYPISLQKLVQATMHIRLHKSKTLTDWRKRPLTKAQLRYAAEDVLHLLDIYRILTKRLQKLSRTEWAREELRRFEQIELYERAEDDRLFRIKGTGAMDGRKLAVVRDILTWREGLAKKYNRPIRIVLKDHLIAEIARHEMAGYQEIRDLRGLNLKDTEVRELANVVRIAVESSPDQYPTPKPRERETPREAVLAALVTSVIRSYCLESQLAYSLVATQKSIKDLIRHRASRKNGRPASIDLLMGWRGETVGAMVDDLLAGRTTVRVEPAPDGLAVHVDRNMP